MNTNKIDLIRAEVERLRNLHQMKCQQLNINDNMCLVECGKRNLCNELLSFIDSMQEEPVSEELEEAAFDYAEACKCDGGEKLLCVEHFKAGSNWQKEHLWKPADGDDLPEIDREVIAILYNGKVVFAHRPDTKGYDGKSITTGQVEHYTPKTYGKGGWNIPNIVYWLDVEIPKEIEL